MVPSGAVRRVVAFAAGCALLAGGLSACGGGERQDVDEPAGTYPAHVLDASFPREQSVSRTEVMRIAVRNTGDKTLPNLAVSIDSLSREDEQSGVADKARPVWIVDRAPTGGDTAYVGTWALGPLKPGATREFTWKLTPVLPGTHTVKWTVAAGLNGKAKAEAPDAGRPQGSFTIHVSGRPAAASVDPETGDVIRK